LEIEQGSKVELDIPQEGSLLKEASRLQQEMSQLKEKANQKLNGIFDGTRAWVSDQKRLNFTFGEGEASKDARYISSYDYCYYYVADENGQPVLFSVRASESFGGVEAIIQEFSGSEQPVGEPNEADEKNALQIYQQEPGGRNRYVEVYPPIGKKSTFGKYPIAGFGTKPEDRHDYKMPSYDNEWYAGDAGKPVDALQHAERTLNLLRSAKLYGFEGRGTGDDSSFKKVTSVTPQTPSVKI